MTMDDPSMMQRRNALKEKIKVLDQDASKLLEENIGSNKIDECLRNIGDLGSTLKNTYEKIDNLFGHIDELEQKVDEIKQEVNRLKDQVNYGKFFSDYQEWVKAFVRELIGKLGGTDNWLHAECGLHYLMIDEPLTKKESDCIECLKKLLKENKDIGLDLTDIKLLLEVRDNSNVMFHRNIMNNLTLKEAELKLIEPVPDNLKIYKPPLKKAFKAISKWRSHI
jgi:hypothetical protein